ncbi:YopX family protein [Bacillus taeanensis]|nr:YopX family protein [Bacillus taeanensis]
MKINKFKVWDTKGTYGGTPAMIENITNSDIANDIWQDRSFIKMQYIGLNDYKGNEIYEGDIIKGNKQMYIPNWDGYQNTSQTNNENYVELDEEEIGIVVYQTINFKTEFIIYSLNNKSICTFKEISNIEVIGNIHTTPELMHGQADHILKELSLT